LSDIRICFRSAVEPGLVGEYKRRHTDVWPDMLRELKSAGWNNYTLHLDDDGLLIGILECGDFDDIRARMALTEVNARWQKAMAGLFPPSAANPDDGFTVLAEVFNLEKQLAAAGNNHEGRMQ
jgi:L-rhamnose mutarotase